MYGGFHFLLSAIAILLLQLLPVAARADAVVFPNNSNTPSVLRFESDSYATSADMPAGTRITFVDLLPGIGAQDLNCTVRKTATINGTLVPGTTNIYQTNLTGVGVQFRMTQDWNGGFEALPVSYEMSQRTNYSSQHYLGAELLVTGPIISGTVTRTPSVNIQFTGPCITTVSRTFTIATGTIIRHSSCSITTKSLNVDLPKVSTAALATAGATAGSTRLRIGLACQPGARAFVTFTDANSPSNRSTNLTLGSTATARNVALRLLWNGRPIMFGPDANTIGNTNQISLGASNSLGEIPLTAEYIATGAASQGSVAARATFTMAYE